MIDRSHRFVMMIIDYTNVVCELYVFLFLPSLRVCSKEAQRSS